MYQKKNNEDENNYDSLDKDSSELSSLKIISNNANINNDHHVEDKDNISPIEIDKDAIQPNIPSTSIDPKNNEVKGNMTLSNIPYIQNNIEANNDEQQLNISDQGEISFFQCHCGKKLFTKQELEYHKKLRHPKKRYIGHDNELQNTKKEKYTKKKKCLQSYYLLVEFFKDNQCAKEENYDLKNIIKEVFEYCFNTHKIKCYSHPLTFKENCLLYLLYNYEPIKKIKEDRTIDYIFYEYCLNIKGMTNPYFFSLTLKYLILLREFWNKENSDENYTNTHFVGKLPLTINTFIDNYLIDLELSEADTEQSLMIIKNFLNWMYHNDYSNFSIYYLDH